VPLGPEFGPGDTKQTRKTRVSLRFVPQFRLARLLNFIASHLHRRIVSCAEAPWGGRLFLSAPPSASSSPLAASILAFSPQNL
jgi:hypothetical protein